MDLDRQKEFEIFMAEFSTAFTKIAEKGHFTIRQKGLEADDLAAWIVGKRKEFGIDEIWLISSDKDWDLLIQDGVSRFSTVTRKETYLIENETEEDAKYIATDQNCSPRYKCMKWNETESDPEFEEEVIAKEVSFELDEDKKGYWKEV